MPARIAAAFWAIKLLTTAFGEATSDYLVHHVNPYLAVVGGFIVFVIAMTLQFRVARYVPWIYWLAVAMVALFGTMAADVLHVEFGVPYVGSTILFAILLAAVFGLWSRTEPTLSIHSITSRRREVFYWPRSSRRSRWERLSVISPRTRSALASSPQGSCSRCSSVLPGLAYSRARMNPILAFWASYVMTRPLGASFADWMGKSRGAGGIGVGDGVVAFVLAALIVAGVAYLTFSGADQVDRESTQRPEPGFSMSQN